MNAPKPRLHGTRAGLLLSLLSVQFLAAPAPGHSGEEIVPAPQGILVTDGSTVHDVGNLLLHMGNWGLIGSEPGADASYSGAPSAEWPAGSGLEYLYGAGLWVGGLFDGRIPAVATAFPEFEFLPTDDPRAIMYRARENQSNGRRSPHPRADDDRDGRIDEDPLNGHDDDGDGRVDEDFAAISDQMFACDYADDVVAFPNHSPMHLAVHQESYAWHHPRYDDFVAIRYLITNTGTNAIADVYAGLFVDPNIGNHDNIPHDDDGFGRALDADGAVRLVYAFDVQSYGRGEKVPGYIGFLLLSPAPYTTVINSSSSASFEDGGLPTNDFERYEMMSSRTIERPYEGPDIHLLASTGPHERLEPGETMELVIAVVMGDGLDGLLENVARVRALYEAGWHIPTALAGSAPASIHLGENVPNPFNPTTRVPFSLPAEGHVRMTVYDVAGRRIDTLVDGWRAAGAHDVTWNATGVASGVYFCRLEALGQVSTRRLIVLK